MKHELQNIISGKSQVGHGAIIQAVAVTLKMAREQAIWLKKVPSSKNKKEV